MSKLKVQLSQIYSQLKGPIIRIDNLSSCETLIIADLSIVPSPKRTSYQKMIFSGRMSANQCLTHPWIRNFAKNRRGALISRSKIRRRVIKMRWWKAIDTISAISFMRRLSRGKRVVHYQL